MRKTRNSWKVNTSNPGKLAEFSRYLGDIDAVSQDLKEPDADLFTIIRYKASQFENVLVDDTSLFIEGSEVGVNIRWLLGRMTEFIGKRASFVCLIGIFRNQKVEIFEGRTEGTIVAARGTSFGFNRHFLPDGSTKTFGEEIPDSINPRFLAINKLLAQAPTQTAAPLKRWDGKFQAE